MLTKSKERIETLAWLFQRCGRKKVSVWGREVCEKFVTNLDLFRSLFFEMGDYNLN
jgi:hypothetical protein